MLLLSGTLTLTEAGQASGGREIDFNHQGGKDTSYTLANLENGEQFTVNILNTCETVFSYEIQGIALPPPNPGPAGSGSRRRGLVKKSLPVIHSTAYGGYIVDITKRLVATGGCTGDSTLESVTLIIFTPEGDDWAIALSSGFTVSGLTDPNNGDVAQLGIAAFVHTYHRKLPWLAPVFALGLRDERPEYHFGIAARLGNKATLNTGYVFGQTSESSPVGRSWFFGVSYSFLSFGEDLIRRPFAGVDDGS